MPLMISTRGYGVQMDTFYRYSICSCTYVYYTLVHDGYVYIRYVCTYIGTTPCCDGTVFVFVAVIMNIFDTNNITTTTTNNNNNNGGNKAHHCYFNTELLLICQRVWMVS